MLDVSTGKRAESDESIPNPKAETVHRPEEMRQNAVACATTVVLIVGRRRRYAPIEG